MVFLFDVTNQKRIFCYDCESCEKSACIMISAYVFSCTWWKWGFQNGTHFEAFQGRAFKLCGPYRLSQSSAVHTGFDDFNIKNPNHPTWWLTWFWGQPCWNGQAFSCNSHLMKVELCMVLRCTHKSTKLAFMLPQCLFEGNNLQVSMLPESSYWK